MQRRSFLGGLGAMATVASVGMVQKVASAGSEPPKPCKDPKGKDPKPPKPPKGRDRHPSAPISIKEFGAVGSGEVDESVAFNTAFAHLVEKGGSLYIPSGSYRIDVPLEAVNLQDQTGGLRIFGDGPSSAILPNLATPTRVFQFGNAAERIVFEDVAFIGDGIEENADCGAVMHAGYCAGGLLLNRCAFAGLRSDSPAWFGLVNAYFCDVVIRDCSFGGCAHTYGAMVAVDQFRRLMIENCQFIDYMDFAQQGNRKTGAASAQGWILAQQPNSGDAQSAGEQGSIIVRQCRFDEGARTALRLDPTGGGRIQRVVMEDCDVNVSGVDGSFGLIAMNVDRLAVRRCRFSWAVGQTRDAVDLRGVEVAELEHIYAVSGATRISADEHTTYVHVRDCVYGELASKASITHVERYGLSDRITRDRTD